MDTVLGVILLVCLDNFRGVKVLDGELFAHFDHGGVILADRLESRCGRLTRIDREKQADNDSRLRKCLFQLFDVGCVP